MFCHVWAHHDVAGTATAISLGLGLCLSSSQKHLSAKAIRRHHFLTVATVSIGDFGLNLVLNVFVRGAVGQFWWPLKLTETNTFVGQNCSQHWQVWDNPSLQKPAVLFHRNCCQHWQFFGSQSCQKQETRAAPWQANCRGGAGGDELPNSNPTSASQKKRNLHLIGFGKRAEPEGEIASTTLGLCFAGAPKEFHGQKTSDYIMFSGFKPPRREQTIIAK